MTRSDQQCMRDDRPSTLPDKRKTHQIFYRSLIPSLHLSPQSRLVFEPASPISNFIDACSGKPLYDPKQPSLSILIYILSFVEKSPLERAQFLESTDLFTNNHAAAAAGGQTAVPDNLDTDLHFTCFVQALDASAREAEVATSERRLIELDGGRAGPVDRGESTDLLKVRIHCLPGLSTSLTEYVGFDSGRSAICEGADRPLCAKLRVEHDCAGWWVF